MILSEDGYVITNTHVVTLDGATGDPSIQVKTDDGRLYAAELVGTDPLSDLAVIKLVDASGLGAGSALPPQLLVDLVLLSTAPTHPELREVATGMPIAGLSGTLADRFTTTAARGLVRAKTGSLPHVTSLAGTVVDADGRLLAFAVIADQTPDGGQWAPRATIDAFVTTLPGCGCR